MALPSNESKADSLFQTPRTRRSTNFMLPTLRVLFRPQPGLGLDARLPFTKHVRWYMSLESYFSGTSAVRFGIEPTKFPFIRFQCAPEVRLSVRLPLLRISEFNRAYFGSQLTIVSNGQVPKLNLNGFAAFYDGLKTFLKPICELQRHSSIGGLLLNDRQREALRKALEKAKTKRDAQANQLIPGRDELLKTHKDNPEIDHEEKARMIKDLREKLQGSWKDRSLNRETIQPDLDEFSRHQEMGPTKGSQIHEKNDGSNSARSNYGIKNGAFVFALSVFDKRSLELRN
ncbi:hypothetical protein BWQ96_05066 [Gracilariopsis chorda]|uniref:Uncharacterized protein n=1 Tax=Gracilariopsis chorda TaxID=448386 RepID=A0A2V3ISR0_9FLOR|nr:hypothetical protein BWQ96_05066 [Gracilariopsis chorda]|eukprot:PXF45165.1 hypothetical protein BWQ96_05066 [Gracilariopsis chorda]